MGVGTEVAVEAALLQAETIINSVAVNSFAFTSNSFRGPGLHCQPFRFRTSLLYGLGIGSNPNNCETVTSVYPWPCRYSIICGRASAVCQPRPLACITMIEPFLTRSRTAQFMRSAPMFGSGSPVSTSHCIVYSP